jgi:hypothetical protein
MSTLSTSPLVEIAANCAPRAKGPIAATFAAKKAVILKPTDPVCRRIANYALPKAVAELAPSTLLASIESAP